MIRKCERRNCASKSTLQFSKIFLSSLRFEAGNFSSPVRSGTLMHDITSCGRSLASLFWFARVELLQWSDPYVSVCATACVWPTLHISDWYGNSLTLRCLICLLVKLQVPQFQFDYEPSDHPILELANDLVQQRTPTYTHTQINQICRLSLWDPGYLLLSEASFTRPCHAERTFIQGLHLISKTIKVKVKDQTHNSIHHECHKNLSFNGSWFSL